MAVSEFEAFPGDYHLIKIDENGNDIPGSDFSCPVRTYEKTFSRFDKQYRVKKNLSQ